MTVKELIESMVEMPDRVVIIDAHLRYHGFHWDIPSENMDCKKEYYRRIVKQWILEKYVNTESENRKKTIYIVLKGDTKK